MITMKDRQMVVCAPALVGVPRWTGGCGILDYGRWAELPMNNFRILIRNEARVSGNGKERENIKEIERVKESEGE